MTAVIVNDSERILPEKNILYLCTIGVINGKHVRELRQD